MAPTIADLLAQPSLELEVLAGGGHLDRHLRWAHVSELRDPTPWLRGGELVLTTGLELPGDAEGQRDYVRRLAARGCVGLGFAEERRELPGPVLDAAVEHDLPLLAVRGATPFIAVVEAVAQLHAEERLRVVRRVIDVQERAARAALRSGPDGILRELARGIDGSVLLTDPHGRVVGEPRSTRTDSRGTGDERSPGGWQADVPAAVRRRSRRSQSSMAWDDGDRTVLVQSLGLSGAPIGWLATASAVDRNQHRLLTNHAAVLLSIEMLGMRAGRSELHEQRAAVFAAFLDGGDARLAQLCGLPDGPYEVLVVRPGAVEVLRDAVVDEPALVCAHAGGAVVVLPDSTPRLGPELLQRAARQLGGELRAGACTAAGTRQLPSAVEWAAGLVSDERQYVHAEDVSATALLRDAIEPAGLARFADAVLGDLRAHDERNGTDLVGSARAYVEHNAGMEAAAASLGIHRNTLRTRLRTVERVTRRSLSDPRQREELRLALTLPELLPPGRE
ncbi:purine catabolism regulator [Saccharopolyspora erythraea NRRL 2338]|uniref:PucR family transcriptional regulator n=1 Tax=Saccharopolyspora erythraea TaxID=1836 RepID=A0ABN1DYJ3_SACER|nr:PucR family transcriptional regulator [Saccharopolyspora erythraea]PFG95951.1 purine catabolism regulator [Saccharopolyspora erythraea NRRL 2338]QRK92516.1 PucR family transcriptional regulator ligand-binding domain-containing protein [Saccharopolyspora erythraea]